MKAPRHVRGTPETSGYLRERVNGFGEFATAKNAQIKVQFKEEVRAKQPVMVSLGVHVDGACLPIPNPQNLVGVLGGLYKRNCKRNPPIDQSVLDQFAEFVDRWLGDHLVPLDGGQLSIRKWLAESHYPQWRKDELLEVARLRGFDLDGYDDNNCLQKRDEECIEFVKRETYPSFKEARLINSRHDAFKVLTGPFFHGVEKELFKLKWFVKYIPVRDRAKVISTLFVPGSLAVCTDYSSFESMFVPKLWCAAEGKLYSYMAKNCSKQLRDNIANILSGQNVMKFRSSEGRITTYLDGTRMSGDMCTSLGNGFTNLMMMLFVAHESGVEVDGYVEGDDGLFMTSGPLCDELFARLGATIKLEQKEINQASFCGNIFDLQAGQNIVDPIEKMVGFGWSTSRLAIGTGKNHKALLEAKARSLAFECPGCPILSSLSNYVLRCVGHNDMHKILNDKSLNDYERERLSNALEWRGPQVAVSPRTRELVSELYGVSVNEQLAIESYFDRQTELKPIPMSMIQSHIQPDWTHFWSHDVHW